MGRGSFFFNEAPTSRNSAGRKRIKNLFENRVRPKKHVIVPETKNFYFFRTQELRATLVAVMHLRMLSAIEFNDETPGRAEKISKERPDGVLTPESEAAQAARSQAAHRRRSASVAFERNVICSFTMTLSLPSP